MARCQTLYHLEEVGSKVQLSLHLGPLVSVLTLSMETDMGEMMGFGTHPLRPHQSGQGAPEEPRPLHRCLLKRLCPYWLPLVW